MILSTANCLHLAKKVAKHRSESLIQFERKQFTDGEYHYRLDYGRAPKNVILMGNVTANPFSLFELQALARALKDNHIPVSTLCIPYLGYGRQDRRMKKGEAVMANLVAESVNLIRASRAVFVSLHSDAVRSMLRQHTELRPLPDIVAAEVYDVIAAPDKGAVIRAKEVAEGRKVIVMPKTRPAAGQVSREKKKDYPVKGKSVLIVDDMIDTGRTIATAADILKKQRAEYIDVAAVHGVFSEPSKKILETKRIRKIFIADTLPVAKNKKIKQISLSVSIAKML